MTKTHRIFGWKLDEADRRRLLERFPPAYAQLVADHVTLGRSDRYASPSAVLAEVVGRADDGAGVEALVVRLGGSTERPDGSIYHITWSLDPAKGRRAQESNEVLRERGWTALGEAIPIRLHPAAWSS